MNRIEKIAGRMVSRTMEAVVDVVQQIEVLRQKYKPTSDEGIVLGILRDMASSFKRGNASRITSLADELVEEMETQKSKKASTMRVAEEVTVEVFQRFIAYNTFVSERPPSLKDYERELTVAESKVMRAAMIGLDLLKGMSIRGKIKSMGVNPRDGVVGTTIECDQILTPEDKQRILNAGNV